MDRNDDRRILQFIEAARAFRAVVENQDLQGKELVRALLTPLTRLYAAGLGLEDVDFDVVPDQSLERYELTQEEAWALFHQLWDRIGPDSCYWQIFDPTKPDQSEEKPVAGNLGDDLADVYRVITPGLKAWDAGDESLVDEVVYSWRLDFSISWGLDALKAIYVIHRLEMEAGWGGPLRDSESD